MAEKRKLPLGTQLIQKGVISEDQLRIALTEQKRSGVPLGKLLISLGFVTEATVREALSENLNQQTAKTWDFGLDIIQDKSLWELAARHGSEFLRFLRAFKAMRFGFASGRFVYGLLIAHKPALSY